VARETRELGKQLRGDRLSRILPEARVALKLHGVFSQEYRSRGERKSVTLSTRP
jgi:hypothetical protein